MRVGLYCLCIFLALFASALFFLGYEGTQIREFLLGVSAIVLVTSRMIRPERQADRPLATADTNDSRRERRLSDSQADLDTQSEPQDSANVDSSG